ncbi:MAG: DUF2878 domain-containing protein [Halioglobus sp.]
MDMLSQHFSRTSAPRKLANAVLFNISWFGILITQSTVAAVAILVVHLFVHFTCISCNNREWLLVAGVTMIGVLIDQLLFYLGVFTVNGEAALAPLWLSCLWPVFATTLMHAFASLQHRVFLATVIGSVGGALSYVAGTRLTDVDFASPLWGPVIIGVLWAMLFPMFLKCVPRAGEGVDSLQSWEPAARRAFD